jgi:hypothetical protein
MHTEFFVGNTCKEELLGRARRGLEDNVKIGIKETV